MVLRPKPTTYPELHPPEKTICKWRWSYPVVHISRGEIRTCDKPYNIQLTEKDFETLGTDAFINNPYLIKRRWEKLKGLKHSDCFSCIKLEEKGIQSSRSGKEPFMDYMKKKVGRPESFEEMTENISMDILRADHPDILEISLSNLCNLKCIYCSSTFSSAWEEEDVKQGLLRDEKRESRAYMTPPSFEKYFWLWVSKISPSLERIVFIGGEPLFHNKLYDYLDKLMEITNDRDPALPKIWLNIISNFNVPDSYFDKLLVRLPNLSKRFNVHIEASGEAFGAKGEYIREGLKWTQFTKNIEKLLALNLPDTYFGFQIAMNALCVSSLRQYLEYGFELQQRYNRPVDFKQNVVVHPEYLTPYILTPDFAGYIEDAIDFVRKNLANPEKNRAHFGYMSSSDRWAQILPFLESISYGIKNSSNVDHLRKTFAEFVEINDKIRNRDFRKTFPEFVPFLELCQSHR
jgi:hypothetical protein